MGRDNSNFGGALTRRGPLPAPQMVQSSAALIGLAALTFVVWGSLTPFAFDLSKMQETGWSVVGQLGWPRSDLRDLVINVCVYMPIGFAGWLILADRCNRRAAFLTAFLTGSLLSFTLETLQQFVATRYPSWIDVMVNSTGTVLGAIAAWGLVRLLIGLVGAKEARRRRSAASDNAFRAAA